MDAEGLSRAVRQQLGLGRLLPLGDAADGAWLVESAAVTALRSAVSQELPDVHMGGLRLSLADPELAEPPAVPPPPSALWPGRLYIDAEFASPPHAPLTTMAELLRATLLRSADRELGLRVDAVDLRITDLLEGGNGHRHDGHGAARHRQGPSATAAGKSEGGHRPYGQGTPRPGDRPGSSAATHPPAPADDPRGAATAQAVISVPGVTRLAPVLGSTHGGLPADAVSVTAAAARDGHEAGRHLRIQLAVAEGTRVLDVARAVRHAAEKAAAWDAEEPDAPVTVAVLVTAIDATDL
ncbi:hypothetical protein [Streptomyces marispadix]|uniref:Nucleopolyhedrovirus P10 family protein n=1 Tax=Streptomyces marispadix TaxID=2922868 RepID=A0ABS9STJ6_9ACTN|nr:hypothetical protein [Streptomyces marispadix]MCH6159577.1 hypothetical protein [Streptomyces marispadix]